MARIPEAEIERLKQEVSLELLQADYQPSPASSTASVKRSTVQKLPTAI